MSISLKIHERKGVDYEFAYDSQCLQPVFQDTPVFRSERNVQQPDTKNIKTCIKNAYAPAFKSINHAKNKFRYEKHNRLIRYDPMLSKDLFY